MVAYLNSKKTQNKDTFNFSLQKDTTIMKTCMLLQPFSDKSPYKQNSIEAMKHVHCFVILQHVII